MKAELSTGEYRTLVPGSCDFESTNGKDKVFRMDNSSGTFQFTKPGTATVKVTAGESGNISSFAEITSEYVPLTSIKPGISGKITLYGRNANSDGSKDFNASYVGVVATPSNASACHYNTKYTITSSDRTIGEYMDNLVKGYVPYKAGKVTYTASVKDGGNTISGTSEVEYVYKIPRRTIISIS